MLVPNRHRILVVEDDDACRGALVDLLTEHGFDVRGAGEAREMDMLLRSRPADLLILDIALPGEDGLSICRRMAGSGGPAVMFVTAAADEVDRIIGLELGADDYVGKPYGERELLARIRAVLRRRSPLNGHVVERPEPGGWTLDPGRLRAYAPDGTPVTLSPQEFRVMRTLVDARDNVVSREQLAEAAEIVGSPAGRSIDVLVSRLRRKLAASGRDQPVRTVRHRGYALETEAVGPPV